MKSIYLKTEKSTADSIKSFLLQDDQEQVIFLLLSQSHEVDKIFFEIKDIYFVPQKELNSSWYSVKLKDVAQAKIIKWAWDKGLSLAEIHSHPFSKKATSFSYSDIAGLKEFVPHVWWRLKNKPYLAMVFGSNDYDALAWLDNPTIPCQIEGILVEGTLLKPTNKTTDSNYE